MMADEGNMDGDKTAVELCRYTSKPLAECDCAEGCETNVMGPGEWVQPVDGYRMVCCDCGLAHILNFRIHEGRIQFQAFREYPLSPSVSAPGTLKQSEPVAPPRYEDDGPDDSLHPADDYSNDGEDHNVLNEEPDDE